MTTTKQAAAKLAATLDSIWRMGDRDECSIKHIGHALAAIMAGKKWYDGADYVDPWGDGLTRDQRTMDRLAAKWAKVQALHDDLGSAQFAEAVAASKFTGYPEAYLADYWTPDNSEIKATLTQVVAYCADLHRAATATADEKRADLIEAVQKANTAGISEYDLAIAAGVSRMTIRAWLGK